MSDRDTTAPRIIPPDRAAKVEHVRHAIRAAHVDWEAIAGRLAAALNEVANTCDDNPCEPCTHATEIALDAIAEFERAKEGT